MASKNSPSTFAHVLCKVPATSQMLQKRSCRHLLRLVRPMAGCCLTAMRVRRRGRRDQLGAPPLLTNVLRSSRSITITLLNRGGQAARSRTVLTSSRRRANRSSAIHGRRSIPGPRFPTPRSPSVRTLASTNVLFPGVSKLFLQAYN